MRAIIFTFLLVSFPVIATETIICNYDRFSDKKGSHKENLSLTYMIDRETEKTYLVGNNGSSEVLSIPNIKGASFVEVTGSGNVMTTTIDSERFSVHSRHSIGFDGTLLPSQYYGYCIDK